MFGSKKKDKELNLLPGEETSPNLSRLRMIFTVISVGAVVLVLIVSAGVFLLSLLEKATQKSLADTLTARDLQWNQMSTKAQNATLLKSKAIQIKGLKTNNQIFVDTMAKIRTTIPSGVVLSDFTFSGQNLQLNMNSPDPKDLYQYVNILNKDKFFTSVEMKSLVKDTVDYRMTLDIVVKGSL